MTDLLTGRRIPKHFVDDLTADIRSVVEQQRSGALDAGDWDQAMADALAPHMIEVASRAAGMVAFGANVGILVPYLKAVAANAAKAWNDETRAAIGMKAAEVPDVPEGEIPAEVVVHLAFEAALEVRAPRLSKTIVTETNSFAKLDTAKRVGKTNKTWVGGRRKSHAAASGQTIPVDQVFVNGLYGPGGPNCGCDLVFDTPVTQKVVDPLTRSDLDIPEDSMSRTRAVDGDEYQELAAEGRTLMRRYTKNSSAPVGLDDNWDEVRGRGWASVQDEWGGATIDAHTGAAVEFGQEKYALTMKDAMQQTVSVPIGSKRADFDAAMDEARRRFDTNLRKDKAHLGVFRNEETHAYEIDPVLVVDSRAEVERIGAYTRAKGGAFSFKDGNGYWPPYVEE